MQDQPVPSRDEGDEATAQLGPILASCHDRSERDFYRDAGQGMLSFYLMPLWSPIVPAAMVIAGLKKLCGQLSSPATWGVLGLVYALVGGHCYWWLFHRPGRPALALHQRGLCRRKLMVAFDELLAIRLGGKIPPVQRVGLAVCRILGKFSRLHADAAAGIGHLYTAGSLTLIYKTGDERALNGILIRPRPDDLRRLFGRLHALHPELLNECMVARFGLDSSH